jgi:hypothetical protein
MTGSLDATEDILVDVEGDRAGGVRELVLFNLDDFGWARNAVGPGPVRGRLRLRLARAGGRRGP